MNQQTLALIQQASERMTAALEALEEAIDANDNRKIGARLFELTKCIKALELLISELLQP